MLGAIIGDIAGSKYEFNNVRTEEFEFMGVGCDYTDDSICTVAVAEAAMTDQDYASHLQAWCRKYPHPMGSYGGNFARWIHQEKPEPYGSWGNGAPMRVASIGWLFDTEAYYGIPEDIKSKAMTFLPKDILDVYNQFMKSIK